VPSKSRLMRRVVFRNRDHKYNDILQRKNIPYIVQMSTPYTRQLTLASSDILEASHIWKTGDRYYKLAEEYYGNSEYWWVIARYNQKPTEGHLKKGDVVFIPTPIERLLEIL